MLCSPSPGLGGISTPESVPDRVERGPVSPPAAASPPELPRLVREPGRVSGRPLPARNSWPGPGLPDPGLASRSVGNAHRLWIVIFQKITLKHFIAFRCILRFEGWIATFS